MKFRPREQHRASLTGIVPEVAKTPFYPALDGLRTIAVGMVVVMHFLPKRLPMGWMGVQLFFVLSGFLITGILYDTRSEPGRFKNFYARRVLRIFPLYYGFLGLVLVISIALRANIPTIYGLWPFYLQNFFWLLDQGRHTDVLMTASGRPIAAIGHLWSLAIEEQFYLIWPIVVFAVKDRIKLMRVCWLVIAARLVLGVVWESHMPGSVLQDGLIYRMLPTQSDGFVMGGLLALWLRGGAEKRVERVAGGIAAWALAGFALLLAVLHRWPALAGGGDVLDYRSGFMGTVGLPLTNAVSLAMLFAVIRRGTWLYRICHLAWMRSVGKVSYGIYVYHLTVHLLMEQPILAWVTRHGVPRAAGAAEMVIAGSLTVALAYASFYVYERPFLLLKNRFTFVRGHEKKQRVARAA